MERVPCPGCSMQVPATWHCLDCDRQIADEALPETHARFDDDTRTETISRMVDRAEHESVTFDTLRSDHSTYEWPLGEYLRADEQPELILPLKKIAISDEHDNSWSVSGGIRSTGHCIVTRDRVVGLVPTSSQPQVVPALHESLDEVSMSSGHLSTALVLSGEHEYKYHIDASESDIEKTVELVRYFQQLNHRDEEAMDFLIAVNQEVDAADDAEAAFRSLADLFAERDGPVQFDQVVAEASTIEDLFAAMTVQHPVTPGTILSDIEGGTTGSSAPLHQRAAATVKNADPKTVGAYSLGAILFAGTAPISAPISTAVAFGGVVGTGTAAGLYADANPNSVVGRVDPIQLGIASRMRGRKFAASAGVGGMKTGMLLGAAKHVGEANADRAGAQWLTELDIDAIMKGQQQVAKHAERREMFDSPAQASAFGGVAGLMYGYADIGDDLGDILDDDLLQELTDGGPSTDE